LKALIKIFVNLYPVWIIFGSLLAYLYPPLFAWFNGDWMVGALAFVMLGMGLTLRTDNFRAIAKMPGAVFLAAILQYTIMPFSAYLIASWFQLSPALSVGLIVVGCCPGGTASNVITYLARGDVALSIIMTTVSTLLAIVATPLLTEALAGTYLPVDPWGLYYTTLQVVLVPVLLGMGINYQFPSIAQKMTVAGPVLSVLALFFVAGSIVALSADTVAEHVGSLVVAAGFLHVIGFALGYTIARLFGYDHRISRTISIESGMQNGGLGAVLAKKNFPLEPMTAVPAIFSSVLQNLIGGLLAAYWRWQSDPQRAKPRPGTALHETGSVQAKKNM
jgi:BASS family bile acid:Na+ symporter